MAFDANFAATPGSFGVELTTANTSRAPTASPTGISPIYTTGANGSRIDDITIQANVTTTIGMIRFWLFDGTTHFCFKEVLIPAVTVSATIPAFNMVLTNLAWIVKAGHTIKASNNNAQSISVIVNRAGDF